jgi:ATP-dependent metalloprotease FtsH
MFNEGAQAAVDLAKDVAVSRLAIEAEPPLSANDLAAALAAQPPSAEWLAELMRLDVGGLRHRYPLPQPRRRCTTSLPLGQDFRRILGGAQKLAAEVPLRTAPGLIGLAHLTAAAAAAMETGDSGTVGRLAEWVEVEAQTRLALLDRKLRGLRRQLRERVYGQDHAVQTFVEALFGIEVVASGDRERVRPAGLFVFAGPPGVGKTYLAELAAESLGRPFVRFDMSGFAHDHEVGPLVGTPPAYRGAAPGLLTQFVKKNRNAILLFDEIEKAHLSAIHLFLQILDAGRLQDRHTEETIAFRGCVLIFTTNVGRRLYDAEHSAGVSRAHRDYYRAAILEALASEADPRTGVPFFPPAICSRLGTGHPILFRPLGLPELVRVAAAELERVAALLEQTCGQHYEIAPEVPLALVLREAGQSDARMVKARAERFLKDELFRLGGLFAEDRLARVLVALRRISVEIDAEHAGPVALDLFSSREQPSVLFAGDPLLGEEIRSRSPGIKWLIAGHEAAALEFLAREQVDLMLLDLQLPAAEGLGLDDVTGVRGFAAGRTELAFDRPPLAARSYAAGQKLLASVRERLPDLPVHLISLERSTSMQGGLIDEETIIACVGAGGARGVVTLNSTTTDKPWGAFSATLQQLTAQARMEAIGRSLARQRKAVEFDLAPSLAEDGEALRLRCRDFRLVPLLRGEDVGAVLSDAERPPTKFSDVFGAEAAKRALGFIRDWLREPKRYAALGVAPPRGVLLTGPPGTGKTMLARALAGESDCAFLSEAATSFVTKWQGSGPENIRRLFERARRYAPAIVFIDEIDAIGRRRSENAHGEEMALNALLTEMDGFARSSDRPVVVIAATNLPELLDPALLRRFARAVEVELPTRSERQHFLEASLAKRERHRVSPATVERLAAQSHGLSIADFERILAEAAVMAVAADGVIDDAILGEAFEKVRFGERKAAQDTLRTAQHEAGHALAMCLTGAPPVYVTTVGRGDFGGYAAFEDREERACRTLPQLEDLLCQLLAGHAAERLFYGEREGCSTGPSSDLERATAIAEAMVCDYGMSPELGFVRIDRRRPLPDALAHLCQTAVRRLIEQQAERAAKLLQAHRPTLTAIVEALEAEGRLMQEQLLACLTPEERACAGKVAR